MPHSLLVFLLIFATIGLRAHANELTLSGDLRWLALASRQDRDEAIGVARAHQGMRPAVKVVQATNGWYAVVAGPERLSALRAKREQLRQSGLIPKDALFSRGEGYVRVVWTAPEPQTEFELRMVEGRRATRQIGDLTLMLSGRRAGDDMQAPVVSILQDRRTIFQTSLDESKTTLANATATALRLDPSNPDPQILVSSNWGGAHCCMVNRIVTRIDGQWRAIEARTLDGGGYSFEDIDGDGAYELVSIDNGFLYRFGPYVTSYAPRRIERLIGSRLVDVTHEPRFQDYLRQDVFRLEHWAHMQTDLWRTNGFLAGWVAAKSLVGQVGDAWGRMLNLQESNPDWTLTVCLSPKQGGECPKGQERPASFPAALRQHLEQNGYPVPGSRSEPRTAALPSAPVPSTPAPREQSPERKGRSTGTGFFVSANGHAVTNAHVVDGCSAVKVRPSDGPPVPGRVLARDTTNDLALLETGLTPGKHASIRSNARLGEGVAVFGFPLSRVLASSGNFTLGNITGLAGIGDDTRFIQISAPVQPGNSGGPLLDEHGNVVGVVTAKLNALRTIATTGDVPQNVNFAIRASALAAFLDSRRMMPGAPNRTAKLSAPDLAEEGGAISLQIICE
jgi:S1-C subfamily serine protease